MSQALWQLSAVEVAAGIRARRFSCSEVMVSVVERIRKLNPKLNAIVGDLTEQALAQAAAADRTTFAYPGPLFGVPITIKVNIDQEGQATTNGLPAFANLIAPADSPLVRNLRSAGAIIVGRTNTPELSMRLSTVNPLHGRTWNRWHPDASSGGSSGGAGVSAAVGFGAIHHGNDIAGSLRFPSFAKGVATLKPTRGRIPAFDPSAPAERGLLWQLTSVQGAICAHRCRCASRNPCHGRRRCARSVVGTRTIRWPPSAKTHSRRGHAQQSRIPDSFRHHSVDRPVCSLPV